MRVNHTPIDGPRGARFPGEGFLDVLLVVLVATAVLTRTPVGGVLQWGASNLTERVSPPPTLVSYFRAAAPEAVDDWAESFISEQPEWTLPGEGGVEDAQLARLALDKVLDERTPAHTAQVLQATPGRSRAERLDEWMARVADDGLEQVLEELAIGSEQRARAIRRATAAGRDDAASYTAHRPFLPLEAQRDADHLVHGTRVLMTVAELWWPTDRQMWVSSRFGMRVHPRKKRKQLHNGVDLAIPVGTELYAPHGGRIHSRGEDDSSGKWVSIEHVPGVRTSYCHLDEILFDKGEQVRQGELFARSGNSGRYNTGAHLHYIVRLNDDPIDPLRVTRLPEGAFERPGVAVPLPGPRIVSRTGAGGVDVHAPAVPAPPPEPSAPPTPNPALEALVEQARTDAAAEEGATPQPDPAPANEPSGSTGGPE